MAEANVQQIEPGIFLIDHHYLGIPGVIGSYLLTGSDDVALIETGPTTTLETLLAGIRAAGVDPTDITTVIVTHIHLDHAGSAGVLLRQLPQARLLVHPIGAPHMIDPSRLVASATRIWGDEMDRLWGEVVPVPEAQIETIADGERFTVAGRELVALSTPGHATHHHAYHDPAAGLVFTGDVTGVRLGVPYVRPPTVPPEFDLEAWRASIARLRALQPRRLCPTHFGPFDDVEWHFNDLLTRLDDWTTWTETQLARNPDTTQVAALLRERGDAEILNRTGRADVIDPYEVAITYQMAVDGIARYARKRAR